MTKTELDVLWSRALHEALVAGEEFTRYRFATLVADAEAKRIHDEGMVTVGHMREQIAAEREACAKVCEEVERKATRQPSMVGQGCQACAAAIRARGNT